MSDRGVSGMIALVTGASGALGRAIAVRLGTGGALVACHYGSNRAGAQETLDAIRAGGGDGMTVGGNVTLREDVDAMVASVLEAHGRIDVLVNCAGITRDGLLVRMADADWDEVIATNLRSAFLGTRAVLRSMMKQRSGRILNVTSVIGVSGNAGQANYAAAKAGMIGLTRSTAREVASRGITCNALAPGYIDAGIAATLTPEQSAKALATVPMGAMGTADDIGEAAAFLCSREARYITGQVLHVDGGMVMG